MWNTDPSLAALSVDERRKLESLVAGFDQSWHENRLVEIARALPASGDPIRGPALLEMVKIDIDRHWQRGRRRSVEDYLRDWPELGTSDTVAAALLQAEYFARQQVGDTADLTHFEQRFPKQAAALRLLVRSAKGGLTATGLSAESGDPRRASATPSPMAGKKLDQPAELPEAFGRYRIVRRLGQGGMGAVFLARDTELDREVALKVPHLAAENKEIIERFYREARAAAGLSHPNICPIYDVGQIDGTFYLTMGYVEGKPLTEFIRPGKPLGQAQAAALVRKLALALEEAHRKGIIHRDLKPANIMINRRKEPVIMDFGLARRTDSDDARITKSGMVVGTPAYMSPEQVGGKDAGPASDIFSLGVILYEMLAARLPFEGSVMAVLGQILTQEPEPPTKHRPDLHSDLDAVCRKAMAKDPKERFASMADFAAALAQFLRGGGSTATISPMETQATPVQIAKPDVTPKPAAGATTKMPAWEEIAREHEAPAQPTRRAKAKAKSIWQKPWPWLGIGGAVVAVLAIVLLSGVIFRVQTKNGVVVLNISEPGAQVFVDNELKITLSSPSDKEPIKIEVPEGKHVMKVVKGGFMTETKEFTLRAGTPQEIRVTLRPEVIVAGKKLDTLPIKEKEKEEPVPKTAGPAESKELKESVPTVIPPVKAPPALVYDFSDPKQLDDFEIQVGQWEIRDGALTGVGGKEQNATIRLKRKLEGPITVSWDQTLLLEPSIGEFGEQKGGLSLADAPRGGLHYDSCYHAGGGFGPGGKGFHNEMQIFAGFALKPGQGAYGPIGQVLRRGEPMEFEKTYRQQMSVAYEGGKTAVRLEGAGWTLVNNRIYDTKPEYLRLWTRNCRTRIDNLRITSAMAAALPAAPPPAIGPTDAGFVPLFNGKDLTGWKTHPNQPGGWTVEGGNLVGRSATAHHLFSERGDFDDFHLHAELKINDQGNSGVYFRSNFGVDRNGKYPTAYEAQVLHSHPQGPLTGSLRMHGAAAPDSPYEKTALRADEWFTLEIIALRQRLTVKINGRVTADLIDPDGRYRKGHLVLQALSDKSATTVVQFRKIQIKELKETEPALTPQIKDDFRPLFNGKDLTGWVGQGGKPAAWKVEGGYLEVPPPGQGNIWTKENFGDFQLQAEFWVPLQSAQKDQARGNSGIYLQGRYEIQVLDSFNNPTKPEQACGALYGQIGPSQNVCKPPEQWQSFDITFRAPRVDSKGIVMEKGRLTVVHNDVTVIDNREFDRVSTGARDANQGTPGPIVLQDHGSPVRFRNLRIRPLAPATLVPAKPAPTPKVKAAFVPLFNGKNLTGWKTHSADKAMWVVNKGILVSGGPRGHLFSARDDYENFHFRVEARINAAGNSGQYFRAQFDSPFPKGYEAQISTAQADQRTGSLYNFVKILQPLHRPGDWFTQEVIAQGNHIVILVNNKKVVDFRDPLNTYTKGHLALQQNNPMTIIQFRKIEVKELPP